MLFSKKSQACLSVLLTPCKLVSFWTSSKMQLAAKMRSKARSSRISSNSRRRATSRCSSRATGEPNQLCEGRRTQPLITKSAIRLPSWFKPRLTYQTSQRYPLRTRSVGTSNISNSRVSCSSGMQRARSPWWRDTRQSRASRRCRQPRPYRSNNIVSTWTRPWPRALWTC